MKGKKTIELKLAELKEGYQIQDNVVILICNGEVQIATVKKSLTWSEKEVLRNDMELGLERISKKIRKGSPITISNGDVYVDDNLIVRANDGKASIFLIEEEREA